MTDLLVADNVHMTYGSGHTAVHAVRGVDLRLQAGEIALVMGPSGSGKTTLLSMLGGLLEPSEGSVSLDGADFYGLPRRRRPGVRARSLGFVFQAFNLLGALTAEQNVLFPARLVGRVGPEQRERAASLLDRVGLSARRHHRPSDLSGGEQQRVALARASAPRPHILLADEPTGNLDGPNGQAIMDLLFGLRDRHGATLVLVTHAPDLAARCDRVVRLRDGALDLGEAAA